MYVYVRSKSHVINSIEGDVDFISVMIVDSEGGEVVYICHFWGDAWSLKGGSVQRPTIGNCVVIKTSSMYVVAMVNIIEVKLQIVGVEGVPSIIGLMVHPYRTWLASPLL